MPFASTWATGRRARRSVLVMAPMYHTNGFATLFSLLAGDHLVVLQKFDAARIVDLIEAHGITTFTATTLMLQRIADLPDIEQRDLSSLVWFLQGAAVISPSLVQRWIDLVGAEKVYQSYGMTEGIGLCAIRGDEWLAHPGSVGRGFRGTEIKILDEDGTELPAGEIGEIYMRSPSSGMFHYIGGAPLPPRTVDGFSTGGDLGWLEPEGYLHIVDRRVDMIITGGANVFPAEVETALIDHPDDRRRRRRRAQGRRVGPAGARDHRGRRPRPPAVRRRRARVRQGTPRRVQGAEVGGVRRRHPAHRGHQGEPRRADRRPRRLTWRRPGVSGSCSRCCRRP